MTLFITEAEMLDRYIDGLKKSASRAGEFLSAKENEKLRLFVDFIDGIKVAAGSAHQLAHSQMNPKWLDTRDILEGIVTVSHQITNYDNEQVGPVWLRIQESLNNMIDTGRRIATGKAMGWQDIMLNLDARAKSAGILSKDDGR